MKTTLRTIVIAVTAIACLTYESAAKIIVVDNDTSRAADFREVQEAHEAAEPGDAIYVMPSLTPYATLTMDKPLRVYGPGYFLDKNRGLQSGVVSATIKGIQIRAYASGTVIAGLTLGAGPWGGSPGLYIHGASGVLVQRVYTSSQISLHTAKSCVFVQNYLSNIVGAEQPGSNLVFSNNIILGAFNGNIEAGGPYVIVQNIFVDGYAEHRFHNATVQNNILAVRADDGYINLSLAQAIFDHNVFIGTPSDPAFQNLPNTIYASDWSEVVLWDQTDSPDGKYQLTADSPARGAGVNGVDIGPFGGDTPYMLSGIPSIPSIFEFNAASTVSKFHGLDIRLKARSNP